MIGDRAICGACGLDIAFVEYRGQLKWWHRDPDTDHFPVLGTPLGSGEWDRIMDRIRSNLKKDADEKVPEIPPATPAVEVECTRKGIGAGPMLVAKPALEAGWLLKASKHNGPVLHTTHGTLLRMADFITIRGRLEGTDRGIAARWEVDDGFKFGYLAVVDRPSQKIALYRCKSQALRAWVNDDPVRVDDFLADNPEYREFFKQGGIIT